MRQQVRKGKAKTRRPLRAIKEDVDAMVASVPRRFGMRMSLMSNVFGSTC
jgi:hypothetical protein